MIPQNILTITQLTVAILLIVCILLQRRGAGGSALTGGSEASYYTKRGFEKYLFIATIILAALFLLTAFINLLV